MGNVSIRTRPCLVDRNKPHHISHWLFFVSHKDLVIGFSLLFEYVVTCETEKLGQSFPKHLKGRSQDYHPHIHSHTSKLTKVNHPTRDSIKRPCPTHKIEGSQERDLLVSFGFHMHTHRHTDIRIHIHTCVNICENMHICT